MRMLQPGQLEHYKFNVSLLPPLLYMSLRGMLWDHAAARLNLQAEAV